MMTHTGLPEKDGGSTKWGHSMERTEENEPPDTPGFFLTCTMRKKPRGGRRGGGQEKTRDKKGAYFVWTPINKKTKKTNTSKKGKEKEKKERKEKEETDAYLKSLSHLEMLICSFSDPTPR